MSNESKRKFSDQDILNDLMQSANHLQNIYNTYSIEASNEEICEVLEDLYLGMKDKARDMFNLMYSKGWYKLEKEDSNKINQTLSKFEKSRMDM